MAALVIIFAHSGCIQADKRRRANLIEQLVIFIHREIQFLRHFIIRRRATGLLLQCLHDRLNLACLIVNRPRHPVESAQLIKDRSTDPNTSVRFK